MSKKPPKVEIGDLVKAIRDSPSIGDNTGCNWPDLSSAQLKIKKGDIYLVSDVQKCSGCDCSEDNSVCNVQLMELGDLVQGTAWCNCKKDFILAARKPPEDKDDKPSRLEQIIL